MVQKPSASHFVHRVALSLLNLLSLSFLIPRSASSSLLPPHPLAGCDTPLDYADAHAKIMASLSDLHIKSYDILFAKDGHMLLRYSATGSPIG